MPESSIGPNSDPAKTLNTRDAALDARDVQKIHEKADTDFSKQSLHHTLGPQGNQASPGNHVHDGTSSPQILAGFSLSGTRGTATAVPSIIAALVALGATDNTTP
jgi:hypothetical protein